jgi:hypothetical protein
MQISKTQISHDRFVGCKKYDCTLIAFDLTEDVSLVSTKNDELVLLVYCDTPDKEYPDLIYQDYFVIDSLKSTKEFVLYDSLIRNPILTFVLIEIDTRKTLSQIEPVVRLNLSAISKAMKTGDSKVLLNLLGDDDLIGMERIQAFDLKDKSKLIYFKGIHIFDSFNYRLEIRSTHTAHNIKLLEFSVLPGFYSRFSFFQRGRQTLSENLTVSYCQTL